MDLMNKEECKNCPVHHKEHLVKLGIAVDAVDYVIALAGNPNTGKSTVFNNLTGLRQHTGNWPGKTVARGEGAYSYGGKRYKMVDLPGTYSLLSISSEEEIARDFPIVWPSRCDGDCRRRHPLREKPKSGFTNP